MAPAEARRLTPDMGTATTATWLPPLIVLGAVLLSDAWVYSDAVHRRRVGRTVAVRIGRLRVDTPEAWLLGCLLLWVVFLPLYLVGRNPPD